MKAVLKNESRCLIHYWKLIKTNKWEEEIKKDNVFPSRELVTVLSCSALVQSSLMPAVGFNPKVRTLACNLLYYID